MVMHVLMLRGRPRVWHHCNKAACRVALIDRKSVLARPLSDGRRLARAAKRP